MTTTKTLLVAAVLSTFAAVSFAQAPAPMAPEHGAVARHHHKHHHHHHRHHHHHGVKAPQAR